MALAKQNGRRVFTREDLLGGKGFRYVVVSVGDLDLRIRDLTSAERKTLLEEAREDLVMLKEAEEKGEKYTDPAVATRSIDRMARLVCTLAVNENGERAFEDGDMEMLLERCSQSVLQEAFQKIVRRADEGAAQVGEK